MTRLEVPDGSNQGFEPDNRPLDHYRGSGGVKPALAIPYRLPDSCLTAEYEHVC